MTSRYFVSKGEDYVTLLVVIRLFTDYLRINNEYSFDQYQ
jgi:hypothetical protein